MVAIWAPARAASSSPSVASGLAKSRFSRIVSWKRWASWVTTPMVSVSDEKVASCTSIPLMEMVPEVTS